MDNAVPMCASIATTSAAALPASDPIPESVINCSSFDSSPIPSTAPSSEIMGRSSADSMLVTRWLEKLLQHFGMHELGAISDQSLVALLARCGEERSSLLQDSRLLSQLRRRVVRLAGAQLDDAFIAMAPDIVPEDEIELISLSVESRRLKGMRYQHEVYRLVESFEPCHRLQALCLGQTLAEKALGKTMVDDTMLAAATSPYLVTRSTERFAVWVNVRILPEYRCQHHLRSTGNILDFAS